MALGELPKLFPECRASSSVQLYLTQAVHIRLVIRETKKEFPNLITEARVEVERFYVAARYAARTDLMESAYQFYCSELRLADTLIDEESADFIKMMATAKLLADLDEIVFQNNFRPFAFCENLISEMSTVLREKRNAQAQIAGPPPPPRSALSIEAPPEGEEGIDW